MTTTTTTPTLGNPVPSAPNTQPNTKARIDELVRAGQLSAADGQRLASALPGVRKPAAGWRVLFDPWERLPTNAGLVVAGVTALASLAVARFGHARFDGTLDLHFTKVATAWPTAIGEQVIAWVLSAIVFWALARAFGAKARLVDLVVAVGAARVTLLASAFVLMAIPLPEDPAAIAATPPALLVLLAALLLPLLVWFVTLLYTGFRHATGLRAPRSGIAFTVALIAAEVLSKIAVSALP